MNLRDKLKFWILLSSYVDMIVRGTSPLSLPDAIADSLSYVKAFGGTEQRNLPDGYIQRQFIYMLDGSYLLTDIVPTPDCKIEFDFQTLTIVSGARTYLGCRDSSGSNDGLRVAHISSGIFRIYGFGTYADSATAVQANTRYKFVWNNKQATITTGGTTVFDNTFAAEGTNQTAVAINGWNTAGTVNANSEGMYLYSFKVWDNQGNLIADYVPAVQQGAVPVVGFYDTVSETFKTATAGTFAAGGEAVPTPDAPMDIISNNGVLKARHQSGLPLGYTLLDYVVFDSTQVIDTGFTLDNDSRIESKCYRTGDDCWFYGASPTNPRVTLYLSRTGTSRWGNQSRNNFGFSANTEYTLIQDKNGVTINGTLYPWTSGTADDFTTSNTLTIGDCNGATGSTLKFSGNFYYMKIYDNGTLVRDFVPCKNVSNVVGLYDRVNGVFYTDTGLVAGSPVSDPVEIYTDGTVETIAFNLIEEVHENWGVNSSGVVVTTSSVWGQIAKVEPNKTYYYKQAAGNVVIGFFASKPELGSVTYNQSRTVTSVGYFTTPNDNSIKYVLLRTGPDSYIYDQSATAEMLLKVGDYQDVQSILDGAVTRNIVVMVLDGTEDWAIQSGTYPYFCVDFDTDFSLSTNTYGGFCSHFQCVNTGATQNNQGVSLYMSSGTNKTRLGLRYNNLYPVTSNNIPLLKQWLADQYAAGTPVMFVYIAQNSTTESVAGQTLQVTDGDNIVEITQASLNNLELEASYKRAA